MSEDEFFAWFIMWCVGVCVLAAGGAVYFLVVHPQEFISLAHHVVIGLLFIVVPAMIGMVAFRVWWVVVGYD